MISAGGTVLGENVTFTVQPQTSVTIIDQSTGQVKALVGGRGEKTASKTLNRASGKIRKFQIIISVAQLLILIVSYIVLEITGNSILTVAVTNVIYLLIFIPRITVNKPYIGITFGYFFKHTLRGVMIVTCISTLVCFAFLSGMEQGWIRLFGTSIVSTLTIAITSWFFALTKGEREKTSSFIRKKIYAIKQN